jgi:hypothetical protein
MQITTMNNPQLADCDEIIKLIFLVLYEEEHTVLYILVETGHFYTDFLTTQFYERDFL